MIDILPHHFLVARKISVEGQLDKNVQMQGGSLLLARRRTFKYVGGEQKADNAVSWAFLANWGKKEPWIVEGFDARATKGSCIAL